MEIIPVLDVARGHVVRGIKGERHAYRPIETPLANGSVPADIAKGLLKAFAFRKLYVADLDGIEGRGRNVHLVPALSTALPTIDIWIDAGTASRKAARSVLAAPITTLVIGSESLETASEVRDILSESPSRSVLSLDFRGEEFMGPPEVFDNTALWPDRVIIMTLARVGSGEGPDLARITETVRRAAGRKVFAAGGVRDGADLRAVKAAGAAGVLLATALHEGKISAGDLKEVSGR